MIWKIDPIRNFGDGPSNDEDIFHPHFFRTIEGSPFEQCKHKFLLKALNKGFEGPRVLGFEDFIKNSLFRFES
jgi:hypothetical protein